MSSWLNGKVIANRRWGERLTSLIIDVAFVPFESGQFVRLGVEIDGEIVARPYSLVNTPQEKYLEVYFNIVDEGPLSPRLFELQQADDILIADRPSGFLTISEVPATKQLWMVATGTGIGPFLSILKSADVWRKFEQVVLVYSVRSKQELAYLETIQALQQAHAAQFHFVPIITREPEPDILSQRVTQALTNGVLEKICGLNISAEESHVMMCGSSDMIKEVSEILVSRNMKKHRRRDPGHFTTEKYH